MIDLYSIIGWIGMLFILLAYFLLATKKLKSSSSTYNILNLIGGIGIVVNTLVTKSWPAMTLNIIWAIIAFYSIVSRK